MKSNERIAQNKPIEIWENARAGWTWRVWKFYKAPGKPLAKQRENTVKDKYGRVFCSVSSPFTGGYDDMGDVYYAEIRENATLIFQEDSNV